MVKARASVSRQYIQVSDLSASYPAIQFMVSGQSGGPDIGSRYT